MKRLLVKRVEVNIGEFEATRDEALQRKAKMKLQEEYLF
jgi:hypothetical protein